MAERRRFEEEKRMNKQVAADRKKDEIARNILIRKDNRQRSVQDMIERTR